MLEPPELRVPTIPVEVTINLVGGRQETVMFYLSAASRSHHGPESLEEFLDRAASFVPTRLTTGDSALISRDAILSVVAARDAGTREEIALSALDMVRVMMREGPVIEGVLRHADPDDHARLSDHLNLAAAFFAVESGDTTHYVNKHHVVSILL
jgi:hypothetical protein